MAAGVLHRGSLRLRLSRRLALQTALGLGLICAAVYVVIAWSLAQRQDDLLEQKQAAVIHLLSEARQPDSLGDVRHLLGDFLAGHEDISLTLSNSRGRLLHRMAREGAAPGDSKRLEFEVPMKGADGARLQAVLTLDRRNDGALLNRLGLTLALAALVGALAVSGGGFWLVAVELAPLQKLVDQTCEVHAAQLDRRLDGSEQAEELQPLVAQFNALLDRLAVAYRQMESFNADVAHELNTPLSTLISSSELALRRPRESAELRETLGSNLEELHRMAGIVSDMLFLSRAERGVSARRTPIDSLAVLAREVVEFHEAALQERELRAEVQGDASASVDASLLRRAISNLLGNASRYADRGSAVQIRIDRTAQGCIRIAVVNQGATVSAEHLPRLFDRFYRADPARSHGVTNHGLGLAIVAGIARMHGGSCFAESAAGVTSIGFKVDRA
jgi:two-component system heavy metal sensor histidine kinase CusS